MSCPSGGNVFGFLASAPGPAVLQPSRPYAGQASRAGCEAPAARAAPAALAVLTAAVRAVMS